MENTSKPNSFFTCVEAKAFSFSPGQLLRRNQTIFSIVERHGDHVILQHSVSFERKFVGIETLHRDYLAQDIIPCSLEELSRLRKGDPILEDDNLRLRLQIMGASEAAINHANKLLQYIQELRSLGFNSLRPTPLLQLQFSCVKARLKGVNGVKADDDIRLSTVYSASRKLDSAGGDFRVLLPNYSNRGRGGKFTSNANVANAVHEVVRELKSNPSERIKFAEIHNRVRSKILHSSSSNHASALPISRSTIESAIKSEFSAYEITRRNKGETYANKVFENTYPRDRAQRPLEVIEFDDKDTRLFLIDESNGLPFGRAYVTAGIDQYSSVSVGFSISERPRSIWSALNAYANCLLPKDLSSADYSAVTGGAEFFGIPGIALFDNALYNHSHAMRSAIAETSNAFAAWAKPRTPTEKSIVEDYNGRMDANFLQYLPGYGGKKPSMNELTSGVESAVLTIQEFRCLFFKWAYDQECNTPRARGLTSRQLWHEGMQYIEPLLPKNLHRLKASIAIGHQVRFRREGILFTGLP